MSNTEHYFSGPSGARGIQKRCWALLFAKKRATRAGSYSEQIMNIAEHLFNARKRVNEDDITKTWGSYPYSLVYEAGIDGAEKSMSDLGVGSRPEGVPAELARTAVSLLAFSEEIGIDLEKAVMDELEYEEAFHKAFPGTKH